MSFTIIKTSAWEKLREEILALAESCRKTLGEEEQPSEWLHNGEVCQILNISKRTLQHYRDSGRLPFTQVRSKCYYKRADVQELLDSGTIKR